MVDNFIHLGDMRQ